MMLTGCSVRYGWHHTYGKKLHKPKDSIMRWRVQAAIFKFVAIAVGRNTRKEKPVNCSMDL